MQLFFLFHKGLLENETKNLKSNFIEKLLQVKLISQFSLIPSNSHRKNQKSTASTFLSDPNDTHSGINWNVVIDRIEWKCFYNNHLVK